MFSLRSPRGQRPGPFVLVPHMWNLCPLWSIRGHLRRRVTHQLIMACACRSSHCKNCTRNRGCGPVHLIAVAPASGYKITKGEDKLTTYGTAVPRTFCKDCGCVVHQYPDGMDFRAVLPTTFKLDGVLPDALQPKMHFNYESRTFNWNDDLPKFKECVLPRPTRSPFCTDEADSRFLSKVLSAAPSHACLRVPPGSRLPAPR